jgi:hypothetical protein
VTPGASAEVVSAASLARDPVATGADFVFTVLAFTVRDLLAVFVREAPALAESTALAAVDERAGFGPAKAGFSPASVSPRASVRTDAPRRAKEEIGTGFVRLPKM